MRALLSIAMAMMLSGCLASARGPTYEYVRADGRNIGADRQLSQQAGMDNAVCTGEAERAKLSGTTVYVESYRPPPRGSAEALSELSDQLGAAGRTVYETDRRRTSASSVFDGCMASRGYVKQTLAY